MKVCVCLFFLTHLAWLNSHSQVFTDSLELPAVTVISSHISKYAAGTKIIRLDESWRGGNKSLADALQSQSPIYIKEYGNGQLATIAIRGTGASHTQVLWNGIDINSKSLGLSDFSIIPLVTIDEINVQYGSSSSLNGSGAIGGTIHLSSKYPEFDRKFNLTISQVFGSFGNNQTTLNTTYSNERWMGKTVLYRYALENDFSYVNSNGSKIKQNNAKVDQYGVSQDLAFKITDNEVISMHGWYVNNNREIQPVMGDLFSNDNLEDVNSRIAIKYDRKKKSSITTATLGYSKNNQAYNSFERTKLDEYALITSYENSIGSRTIVKIGGNIYHISAETNNFETGTSEIRSDLFASVRFQIRPNWHSTFNARQNFVSNYLSPFSPSIGNEIYLVNNDGNKLIWKSQGSRSYRVPTLNDRYWSPGGNIDLKPEQGYSVETGLLYKIKGLSVNGFLDVTLFNILVKDWILWQPDGSIWRPQNVQKVNNNGIEFTGNITDSFGDNNQWKINLLYSFSNSTIKETVSKDFVGNQLPYTPKHQLNITSDLKVDHWHFLLRFNHTGKRFEALDNGEGVLSELQAYSLFDLQLDKDIDLKRSSFNISFILKNLFNRDYQNYLLRAMPGRNYQIQVQYKFKSSNK